MRYLSFLYPALLATTSFIGGGEAINTRSSNGNKVKLSNVQSLTLRKGLQTSHRRVSALPQLKCIGGSAKGLYDVDVMRCKNEGADYNEEDIQWKCTASLPEEFKLGSTDVICEGYDYPDDPYILKGSCGVEYKLVLTDKGHKKYGHKQPWFGGDDDSPHGPATFGEKVASAVFWMIFIGIALWIVYSAFVGWTGGHGNLGGAGNRPGWGGGGGGGGGWGGNDDPPPPYDWRPSQTPKQNYGTTQGWRPGFWSGALGGAAAGYAAGRTGNRSNTGSGWGSGRGSSWDNGEGSSRSPSNSPTYSSTRHESTGFGSTSRR